MSRKTIFVSLLCVFCFHITEAQWNWNHTQPQGNELHSLWFLNPDTGFIVGKAGTILKTADGGITWSVTNFARGPSGMNPNRFNDVHFPDSQHGYVVDESEGNIYKTADCGQTWTFIKSFGQKYVLNSVHFSDSLHGMVVGGWEGLHTAGGYRTIDGGLTWLELTHGFSDAFNSVFLLDSLTGYIAGINGLILRTTDGGISWSKQNSGTTADLYSINFVDPLKGFAVGEHSTVLKTMDAGNTWTILQDSGTSVYISLSLLNPDTLMILGMWYYDSSFVLRSFDGGVTLSNVNITQHYAEFLNRVFISDGGVAYTVGAGGAIFKSNDYGNSWISLTNHVTCHPVLDIDFPTPETGYAVTSVMNTYDYNSVIIKTTDGGQNWFALDTIFQSQDLYTMKFVTPLWGTVAGDNIYTTSDGGISWICRYPTYPPHEIKSVDFSNVTRGIAVGGQGIILITNDMGQSWTPVPSSTTADLSSVCFISHNIIFVGGDKVILKSTDGGLSWTLIPSAIPFNSISFVNSTTGYGVGGKAVYKTVDGGNTWEVVSPPGITSHTYYVKFIDADTGFVAGGYNLFESLLMKTTDRGETWKFYSIPSIYELRTLEITSDYTLFAGGYNGNIFKATNGGCVVSTGNGIPKHPDKLTCYPNPFSDQMRIVFEVDEPGPLCIDLFDMNGVKIRTLANEFRQKGACELDLYGAGLADGLYLLHLTSGRTVIWRKICKVR